MRNYLGSTFKNSRRSTLILAVFILLAIVFLAGCSSTAKDSSNQTEKNSRIKVKLPANFPEKFPIPTGGKLLAARQDRDDQGTILFEATWETSLPNQEIIDSYQRDLPANGWEVKNVSSGESPDIAFKKPGDLRDSHLRVATINKKHVIQVLVY